MMGAWEKIVPALERLSGDTGVYLCNLVTGDTVSYTHLDVYKRQAFHLAF